MVVIHRAVQAEDKAARRAAILAAAEQLIGRNPESFASVAEVAEAAGLAKGTVYLYFRTKEEIVLAVHAQHSEGLFARLDATLAAELNRDHPPGSATYDAIATACRAAAWLRPPSGCCTCRRSARRTSCSPGSA